ncbi:hypothetical protein [Paenibacillus donghaensis]|uniref:hypothetical protein n=1 Tax=Paenibacillus donghaensis TaxID=414771 RepID=UPI0012F948AE|nr:hypothetical protein [Paenibacillus donghaensis]
MRIPREQLAFVLTILRIPQEQPAFALTILRIPQEQPAFDLTILRIPQEQPAFDLSPGAHPVRDSGPPNPAFKRSRRDKRSILQPA